MRIRSVLLAALIFVGACKREAPAPAAPTAAPAAPAKPAPLPEPVAVAEQEPNDFQRAQLIPARALVSGSIAPPRPRAADEDWYRVPAGVGAVLALRLELKGAQAMELSVFDRDRNKLLKLPAPAGEGALVPAVACAEACFVVVSGAVAGPYSLSVLGAPPAAGQELEPNGRAVDANELIAGKPMQGTLGTPDDEDWYRLQLAAPQPGQFLRLEVSGVAGVRPELEVRALSDGALLASARAAAAGEGIFVRDLALGLGDAEPDAGQGGAAADAASGADAGAVSGAYAGAVSGADAGAASGADAGAASGVDAGAANGATGAGDGGAGGPGGAQPDARFAQPDARFAQPVADPSAQGGASTQADAGVRPDAIEQQAADAGATGPAPAPPGPASPPAPPAGYYLVLKSSWLPAAGKAKAVRGHDTRIPYTLLATLESGPADLEREPNDDLAHATLVGPRGTATGYLAPAGDADWYRVHADAPMVLRAEVSGLDRADLELSAWAPPAKPGDKPTLLARANEGGVKEGEVLPAVGVPAGDTYLKIESAQRQLEGKWLRDGEDRGNLYKLTATLTADDGTLEREPNNDPESAQLVSLPAELKGYLWPHRDLDVFRFHVGPDHAPLNFHLGLVRGMDLALRLFELKTGKGGKLSAEVIGSADAAHGEGEEQLFEVPMREGDYAIEVSSPRGKDASATLPYQLTIK